MCFFLYRGELDNSCYKSLFKLDEKLSFVEGIMSTTSSSSIIIETEIDPDKLRFFPIQFGMFLFLFILNIPSCIFYLVYSFTHAEHRKALHNHNTIVFIMINLFYHCTNGLFYMYYFHNFHGMSSTREFRLTWGYIDWAFMMIQFIYYAWISIERHILIFHDHLVATKRRRFLFHYLPSVMTLLYCLFYYSLTLFAVNCDNINPESLNPTFDPCSWRNEALHTYETFVNQIGSVFMIAIASTALLIRIIWQKYRVQQQIHWRRHRRMAIQLLSVSLLYLLLPTPYILVFILNIFDAAKTYAADVTKYYLYLGYYALFLHPVVCVITLPAVSKKVKKWIQVGSTAQTMTVAARSAPESWIGVSSYVVFSSVVLVL